MNTPELVSKQLLSLTNSKSFWGRAVWVSAIAVVLPPLLGASGLAISLFRGSWVIEQSAEADAEALLGDIYFASWATIWGFVISFFALIIFAVAFTLFIKRRRSLRAIEKENLSGKPLA